MSWYHSLKAMEKERKMQKEGSKSRGVYSVNFHPGAKDSGETCLNLCAEGNSDLNDSVHFYKVYSMPGTFQASVDTRG